MGRSHCVSDEGQACSQIEPNDASDEWILKAFQKAVARGYASDVEVFYVQGIVFDEPPA